MLENMDAAAREALLRPALDAYAGVQLKFEAVEGVRAGDCVGVCARCARVLTANRKCARCKVANYCSRDCQARHWDVHKATCRPAAPDGDRRVAAPARAVPVVQAVGVNQMPPAARATMNQIENSMQGLAQLLRDGGAGAEDMRNLVQNMDGGGAPGGGQN
mmetsp:Transcript_13154/g.40502  ORF Transcript_13154/g.40502 Transcript_13154/m.40502 type:complete len:161 (+) Transcript_13154:314-796(+)